MSDNSRGYNFIAFRNTIARGSGFHDDDFYYFGFYIQNDNRMGLPFPIPERSILTDEYIFHTLIDRSEYNGLIDWLYQNNARYEIGCDLYVNQIDIPFYLIVHMDDVIHLDNFIVHQVREDKNNFNAFKNINITKYFTDKPKRYLEIRRLFKRKYFLFGSIVPDSKGRSISKYEIKKLCKTVCVKKVMKTAKK